VKSLWIIVPAAFVAIALHGLHRGISVGVTIYIPDAGGPLPHHSIMMCRYRFVTGVVTLPPRTNVTSDPTLPNVGECPFFAS